MKNIILTAFIFTAFGAAAQTRPAAARPASPAAATEPKVPVAVTVDQPVMAGKSLYATQPVKVMIATPAGMAAHVKPQMARAAAVKPVARPVPATAPVTRQ